VKVFTQSHYNLIVSQYSEVIIGNDQIVVWPVGCLAAFGGDGHKTCACAVGAQPCCGAGSGSVCHGALARPRLRG